MVGANDGRLHVSAAGAQADGFSRVHLTAELAQGGQYARVAVALYVVGDDGLEHGAGRLVVESFRCCANRSLPTHLRVNASKY